MTNHGKTFENNEEKMGKIWKRHGKSPNSVLIYARSGHDFDGLRQLNLPSKKKNNAMQRAGVETKLNKSICRY